MPKAKLFVAVVVTQFEDPAILLTASQRSPERDWAAFVGVDRGEVIEHAIEARSKWHQKGNGPYRILVGTLGSEITVPVSYEEVAL